MAPAKGVHEPRLDFGHLDRLGHLYLELGPGMASIAVRATRWGQPPGAVNIMMTAKRASRESISLVLWSPFFPGFVGHQGLASL